MGIGLLLQASFRSWGLAGVGLLGLLAALGGGVLTAGLFGGASALGPMLGLLAVLGIAARQVLLLVGEVQGLEGQAGTSPADELIIEGAGRRLRALLVSAATIAAALLPFALLGSGPGLEIAHAITVVVLGGLAASTLYTLFVLPPLVLWVQTNTQRAPDLGLART